MKMTCGEAMSLRVARSSLLSCALPWGNPPPREAAHTTKLRVCFSPSPGLLYSFIILSGNPLQYSCLENPVDRGAWWAAVHGVA